MEVDDRRAHGRQVLGLIVRSIELKKICLIVVCLLILPASLLVAQDAPKRLKQPKAPSRHELFPFAGVYAPDRFQSSVNIGFRYDYHFADHLALGASVGFAKAGQTFFQQVGIAAPEQGSANVLYYNGRISFYRAFGRAIAYLVGGVGVTRQHSESNLTGSIGVGTKFPVGRIIYLRYEVNDHIFRSGKDATAWTNNNLEVAVGLSFSLR